MMNDSSETWFLYMIRDKFNRIYIGITNDIDKRFKAHLSGNGAKFLRGASPLCLIYRSSPISKHVAASYERHFKKLTKAQKEQWCTENRNVHDIKHFSIRK